MQKHWELLKRLKETDNIPHALLFAGPKETAKKDLALKWASLFFGSTSHPDLTLLGPQGKEITIAQIRELIWKMSLKPYAASLKMAIIDKAHSLNQEAQNAFLKLLEEPKGRTIFILITEYPETLLPTILSRVQRLKFYAPPEKVDFQKEEKIKDVEQIIKADLAYRFQYAKKLAQDPESLRETLELWLKYFRELFLQNPSSLKLRKSVKNLQTVHHLLSTTNVNARLALEIFFLDI